MRWALAVVLVALSAGTAGTRVVIGAAPPAPIEVAAGDGAPVITDGLFTPGEWDDARQVGMGGGLVLYVKEYRGVVFIGIRGGGATTVGPSELSLSGADGRILKLHASFALYEVVLPASGEEPKPRLGFTSGWYANEFRRDEDESERLRTAGKPPFAAIYPSDGLEFVIRREKIPGPVWKTRVWASALVDGQPRAITYPEGAVERATDAWVELRLR